MPTHSSSTGSTSTGLLDRARASVPESWLRLNAVYGPLVYGWCRKSGVPEADAADVVQEVFRSILTNLRRFRKDQPTDSFRAWVRTITKNKVTDYKRGEVHRLRAIGGSHMRERLERVPSTGRDPEADDRDDEKLTERVLQLIQRDFDEKTWRAFWRSTVEGAPAANIAVDLAMTKGAVRQAKYRVLRRLRDELAEWQ